MKIFRSFLTSRALRFFIPLMLFFFLGISMGRLWGTNEKASAHLNEVRQGGHRFINPLLECEVGGSMLEQKELLSFKNKLSELLAEEQKKGWASSISVYFRDLNNGPFFGINYEERFAPASLLKVPTMMALFKEAESNPWILTKKVLYNGSFDTAEQNVAPSFMLEKGNQYTIDELAFRMIAYSDNKAQSLLLENLENKFFDKAYMDLGLLPPGQDTPDNFMTVKEYATFFRMLYNASYLNRAYSEKALDYLSKSEFRDGLIAGVPQGITVAHKFGERNFWNDAEGRQIHDCGIVYYPGHPYLLCVMSKGRYFQQLNDSVREISELAYTEVDRQYGRASGDYLAR